MNTLYVVLGCAVTSVSLLTMAFQVGRWSARQEDHLREQDREIAALHDKLDKLQP